MGGLFVQRFLPAPRTCPGGLEICLEMVNIKYSSRQTVGVCWVRYNTVRPEDLTVVFVLGGATVPSMAEDTAAADIERSLGHPQHILFSHPLGWQ
jgi:hypothetical protein